MFATLNVYTKESLYRIRNVHSVLVRESVRLVLSVSVLELGNGLFLKSKMADRSL